MCLLTANPGQWQSIFSHDSGENVVPAVAERWELADEDGVTYTFHLRADARWSNGDPLTAEDFVYAWRRVIDPATGSAGMDPVNRH
jgi:oligopeptide transport system substrate-binding protein